jgi:hypothetical protein
MGNRAAQQAITENNNLERAQEKSDESSPVASSIRENQFSSKANLSRALNDACVIRLRPGPHFFRLA